MAPKSSRKARASTSKPSNASKEPPRTTKQLNAVDSPAAEPQSVVAVTHSAVAEAQPNVIEPQHATIGAEARKPDSAAATISEDDVAPQTCGTAANGGRGEIERKEGNSTEKVSATGAHEDPREPEAGARIEEAGNVGGVEEEEEEEFEYVIAEFGGPGFLTSSAANEDMALTVGEYEETLGTSLLFCEGLEENDEGGVEGRRKIEFLGKTTKRIRFSAP